MPKDGYATAWGSARERPLFVGVGGDTKTAALAPASVPSRHRGAPLLVRALDDRVAARPIVRDARWYGCASTMVRRFSVRIALAHTAGLRLRELNAVRIGACERDPDLDGESLRLVRERTAPVDRVGRAVGRRVHRGHLLRGRFADGPVRIRSARAAKRARAHARSALLLVVALDRGSLRSSIG